MTTPRRAPATPDANTKLSARAVTFAPSAHNVGQAAKRAGVNEHGSPVTVPDATVDSDATDTPDSPDTPTEPSRTPMHEEPPTEAEVTAPLHAPTGSDVSLDTALGWPTLGEANTREGTRNTHHTSAQPTLQATPNPPPPQPTTATNTNTTHNPASACTVLPATALRPSGAGGVGYYETKEPPTETEPPKLARHEEPPTAADQPASRKPDPIHRATRIWTAGGGSEARTLLLLPAERRRTPQLLAPVPRTGAP